MSSVSNTCRRLALRPAPPTVSSLQTSRCRCASTFTPFASAANVAQHTAPPKPRRAPLSKPLASPEKKQKQKTVPETIAPQLSSTEVSSVFSQELFVFRCDVTATQIRSAMQSYPQLRDVGVLTATDISNLARQIHATFRVQRIRAEVAPYLKMLVKDLGKGKIPGHPLASVHIISCLKDMEQFEAAEEFWNWCRTKDIVHCDARTYGAAIEMLAYKGTPLPRLEELWSEALERYSTTTVLSVARDTGRGTPVMLLQGIITARLLNGDWRSAYEAFDICIRLYPTLTPSRIYELFIYERPIREAFIVFLVACRAGSPPKAGVLTPLLKETFLATNDPRALLRLVYNYVASGGTPNATHLNCLISAILSDSPPSELPDNIGHVRTLISAFSRLHVPPNTSTFNTIISIGGKLKEPTLVVAGLKELLAAGLRPDEVTHRTNLLAVAHLGERARLRDVWDMLKDHKISTGRPWRASDWHILLRACLSCSDIPFIRRELEAAKYDLGPAMFHELSLAITNALTLSPTSSTTTSDPDPLARATAEAGNTEPTDSRTRHEIHQHIRVLAHIFSSSSLLDFPSAYPDGDALFTLDPNSAPSDLPQPPTPALETLQEIYNTLSPPPPKLDMASETTQGTGTATGYTLEKLRFENWRAVNRLLFEASIAEIRKARKAARVEAQKTKDALEKAGLTLEQTKAILERDIAEVAATEGSSGPDSNPTEPIKSTMPSPQEAASAQAGHFISLDELRKKDLGYELLFWNEERAKRRIKQVVEMRKTGEEGWKREEMEVRGSLVDGKEPGWLKRRKGGRRGRVGREMRWKEEMVVGEEEVPRSAILEMARGTGGSGAVGVTGDRAARGVDKKDVQFL